MSAFRGQAQTTHPRRSEAKLFRIEFSDLHVSKEDSVKPWCDQLESQLFEAEYLADEDSVFVPADVAAIVHPSQKETLRVREPPLRSALSLFPLQLRFCSKNGETPSPCTLLPPPSPGGVRHVHAAF
jgi:hypothetical protein